jgi:hypothetical protein
MSKINDLAGKYTGQTAYIVGKGPSLEFLRKAHICSGPVIAINEAIHKVEALGLDNPLYAMNKDGCRIERAGHACPMAYPCPSTVMILQAPGYSQNCFPEHPHRIFVNPVDDLGFSLPTVMSVRMCISILRIMGCNKINLVCFDSMVNGDVRIFNGVTTEPSGASGHYAAVVPLVKKDLADIAHEYILPTKE